MSLTAQSTMSGPLGLAAFPARPRQGRLWPVLVATLASWRACRRTRQHLATLNDRELADVGLSRTQQHVECAKPFWQA